MKRFLKNKKLVILLLVLVGILGMGLIASAQVGRCRNVVWPNSPSGVDINAWWDGKKCIYADFPHLVQYVYEWAIALGGLAAFIALVIAGFQYLTSVGNPAVMKEAMDRIKSASLGLVLLLSSWLILNTINPELTTFRPLSFNPEDIPEIEPVEIYPPTVTPCKKVIIYAGENFLGGELTSAIPNECKATKSGWWFWTSGITPGSSRGCIDADCNDLVGEDCTITEANKAWCIGKEIGGPGIIGECKGNLRVYSKANCTSMFSTLSPTNKVILLDREILSFMLFLEEK